MLTTVFILVVVFAYLSNGYYIAKKETNKDLAVNSFSAVLAWTLFGPAVIASYTLVRIYESVFWRVVKAVSFLAKYLPKKKAKATRGQELKPKTEASINHSDETFKNFAEQLLGQQNAEQDARQKVLDSRPDAKVLKFTREE